MQQGALGVQNLHTSWAVLQQVFGDKLKVSFMAHRLFGSREQQNSLPVLKLALGMLWLIQTPGTSWKINSQHLIDNICIPQSCAMCCVHARCHAELALCAAFNESREKIDVAHRQLAMN